MNDFGEFVLNKKKAGCRVFNWIHDLRTFGTILQAMLDCHASLKEKVIEHIPILVPFIMICIPWSYYYSL